MDGLVNGGVTICLPLTARLFPLYSIPLSLILPLRASVSPVVEERSQTWPVWPGCDSEDVGQIVMGLGAASGAGVGG